MTTLPFLPPRVSSAAVTMPRPTSRARLDEALSRLRDGSRRFVRLTLDQRVALARSMQAGYLRIARASVEAACAAKGIGLGTPLEGEEWTLGPWIVVRQLRLLCDSLLALKRQGNTRVGRVGCTADDRLTVQAFPGSAVDGVLFRGVRVDVHLQARMTPAKLNALRARFYKSPEHDGRVVLVLGGGNVNAIPATDALTKLFNEGKACIIKMNPLNAYLGPFLEEAFADAIRRDFLAVAYGGAEEGGYLARHPAVDEVHLTGSDRTFDALVWGAPDPERSTAGIPVLAKPVTAELGNVSPVLVVPGPYSDQELAHQAEDVASGLTYNASFDCNANKILITPAGWPRRDAFLEALRRALASAPARQAYYPGTREGWHACCDGRPQLSSFGTETAERLPWALVTGLDACDREERAFARESFCPVLFETSVDGTDPLEFLGHAVALANDRLWGTLSAELVVHPRLMHDRRTAEAVEQAIIRLRYGTVTVNAWAGYAFGLAAPPWGAHPGSTLSDIQSGCGWVHNTAMLEGIEKVVLRHPITVLPKPGYFASHRSAHLMMPRMTGLEERGSWAKLPGVMAAAMRA